MAETTQTTATTATAQNQPSRVEEDTLSTLRSLEKKLESMTSSLSGMTTRVNELSDAMGRPDSPYFTSMASVLSSSMMGIENERRIYDEAQKQNEEARKLSSAPLERGQAGFWEMAFAPQPTTQADMYKSALTAAFSDTNVLGAMKKAFGLENSVTQENKETNQIIKAALNGNADDRTFSEKALDTLGLGGINTLKNWWKDRDVRAEEKETAKDEALIKRSEKERKRLSAQYRKMKAGGASEDELESIRNAMQAKTLAKVYAAQRIRERKNDDLAEMPDGMPSKETMAMDSIHNMLSSLNETFKNNKPVDTNKGNAPAANTGTTGSGLLALPAPGAGDAPLTGEVLGKALNSSVSKIDRSKVIDAEIVGGNGEQATVKALSGDNNEPVEIGENTKSGLDKSSSAKEAADIQRKLDTQMRPDFYKMGTEFFKKGNDGSLFDGVKKSLSSGLKGLGGGLLKGGLYGALAVGTLASIGHIITAADALLDLPGKLREAKNTANADVTSMYDKGKALREERAKTHTYRADIEKNLAEQESLYKELYEKGTYKWMGGSSFDVNKLQVIENLLGGKKLGDLNRFEIYQLAEKFSDDGTDRRALINTDKDARKKIDQLLTLRQKEREMAAVNAQFMKDAEKQGIGRADVEKLNEYHEVWVKEQEEKQKQAYEQLQQWTTLDINSLPGFGDQKMAPGSLAQVNAPNAVMPGVQATPEKVETAEEQAARLEDATYKGTKRALTDEEVKQQTEEAAKLQGQQINESLVGRK